MTPRSGQSALEILKSVRPDLILLDICMPEMDGFELARRLSGDPDARDIPNVATTGLAGAEEMSAIEVAVASQSLSPSEFKSCRIV